MRLNKTLRHCLLFHVFPAMLLWLLFSFAYAQTGADDKAMHQIRSFIAEKAENKQFMGEVLVAKGDTVLFHQAYGVESIDSGKPLQTNTVFPIASVSKQFIAATIMQLQQAGKLTLKQSICDFIDSCPNSWQPITLTHLLNHQSGLADYTRDVAFAEKKYQTRSQSDIVDSIRNQPLQFTPGSRQQYSNSGYFLLGMVIERVSKQPLAIYLKQQLFMPAALDNTHFGTETALAGHQLTDKQLQVVAKVDNSNVFAAGAISATATDLARWNNVLHSRAMFEDESGAVLPGITMTAASTEENSPAIYHASGFIDGFNAELAFLPADKLSVVVLANVQGEAASQINWYIIEQLSRDEGSQSQAASQASLASYVGVYQMERKGINTKITLLNETLIAQLPGMPPMLLDAQDDDEFLAKDFDVRIRFKTNQQAEVTGLTIRVRGRLVHGRKISEQVNERPTVSLSTEQLTEFVGTYRVQPGFDITVLVQDGGLFAQATGQPGMMLFPESDNQFFAKVIDLQVLFNRNRAGDIEALTILQGPAKTQAKKL